MVATVRRRDEARRSVMPHLTDQLSPYLDGILTPEDAATVASHLAECAECRGTLDDLQAVRNLLRTVPSRAPHPSLLPRTLAGLGGAAHRRATPWWMIAAAGTALGLALLLQVRLLPAPHPDRAAGLWYFQQHAVRSEEHTSELQSPYDLVCRLL